MNKQEIDIESNYKEIIMNARPNKGLILRIYL